MECSCMPFYEFKCEKCGHLFTLRRSIARRNDPARCPSCESDDVRRVVSQITSFGSPGEGTCAPGTGFT